MLPRELRGRPAAAGVRRRERRQGGHQTEVQTRPGRRPGGTRARPLAHGEAAQAEPAAVRDRRPAAIARRRRGGDARDDERGVFVRRGVDVVRRRRRGGERRASCGVGARRGPAEAGAGAVGGDKGGDGAGDGRGRAGVRPSATRRRRFRVRSAAGAGTSLST